MPAANSPSPVYLLDASIYIFQAHFSPYVECLDSEGEDLSAVFGFTQFLLQFLKRTGARHVAVAHDESLFCGFRHELCPDYKSNRELPDDNLARQLAACNEICQILGVTAFASRRYEADDIIGTLASRCRLDKQTTEIQIVSRDKDLGQLLAADQDCVWDYNGNKRRYRDDIHSEFGVHPEQLPDYLGLVGDSVDCITGVPGVGPVKAKELLARFGDMDGVYNNLDAVASLPVRGAAGLAKKLAEHRELAELSKLLATIVCDIDDKVETCARTRIDDLAVNEVNSADLTHFLNNYRFDQATSRRLQALADRLSA